MIGLRSFGPLCIGLARNLPFLPSFAERLVEFGSQGLKLKLEAIPDDVDFGVVGDAFQSHMRRALVYESVANVIRVAGVGRRLAGQLSIFGRSGFRILEDEIIVLRAHQPRARKRECHARGVYSDPTSTPVFRNGGRRARAAGRIEHEIAGVGGHQDAALDNFFLGRLDDVDFVHRASRLGVGPKVGYRENWKIPVETKIRYRSTSGLNAARFLQSAHAYLVGLPSCRLRRSYLASVNCDGKPTRCPFSFCAANGLTCHCLLPKYFCGGNARRDRCQLVGLQTPPVPVVLLKMDISRISVIAELPLYVELPIFSM
jgi:hypothetical protein